MATLLQYNALTPMPTPIDPDQPPQPTAAQLQTAKNEYEESKKGDEQPLPPPFTYGKIYRWLNDTNPILKVAKAPSLSSSELKQLILDLPKPDTQLTTMPTREVQTTSFLDLARQTLRKKKISKIMKKLNAKIVNRATRQPMRRNQDNYKLLIELSTELTGKHTIFYSSRMTQQKTNEGPLIQDGLGLPQSFNFPEISRKDKTTPYSQSRDIKNKKWNDISRALEKWLDAHFHKGRELALPNPLYHDQTRFDKIFRISDFIWQFLPNSLDTLTGKKQPFKFYITNNLTNRRDPNLYIVLKVRLIGRLIQGSILNPGRSLPVSKPIVKNGKLKKASSACSNMFIDLKTIVYDKYHAAPGIFTDSASDNFEKKMVRATSSNIASKNIKLYYDNRKKALAFWEQEYYCRQAMNFNAGIDSGWPDVNMGDSARYPFDPWTLQPAVPTTSKIVTYPNGLPRQGPNGEATVSYPDNTIDQMRAWYALQQAPFDRPPWPIPFSPLGMSLKPKEVLILFQRINNFLNNPEGVGIPLPEATITDAIDILQPLLIQGKLPKLTTVDLTQQQWNALFKLYEYVLYNRYDNNETQVFLEPYEPYPNLPLPPPGQRFGTWLISRTRRQYAIPVSMVEPWPATAPVTDYPLLNVLPEVNPRRRVSWQQVKSNRFYEIEAKKWAEWMILVCPFPIPGFPLYSSYITLLQKYKINKLNATSIITQPSQVAPSETNCKLPPNNFINLPSSFRRGARNKLLWTLPSEANRTSQYINPYSAVNLPDGWPHPDSILTNDAQPSIGKWLFTGPEAGKYPTQIWPVNNMRINGVIPAFPGALYPPLEILETKNIRRTNRHDLGGWKGGKRRKTLRKYKNLQNKTLKRRIRKKGKKN
uniref:Uncharacterized protein n=1 Tax=viral metagenome TaxID=1070528 RepID=A0A6C0C5L2_9ZZZZ